MTDPCGARDAAIDDLDAVAELARSFIADLRPQRGGEMWAVSTARTEPVTDRLREEILSPHTLVVVGEYLSATVGYAVAVLDTTTDGRIHVRITDLFTLEEARHVGVGEAMMTRCLDWARTQHASSVDAMVLPGTRDAKNFFEGFGFTARALTVNRPL